MDETGGSSGAVAERPEPERALGERLQQARKAAGLTQQQLCHEASLSYSTLAKIERGAIKSPSIFTIQSITGALGITLDGLMGTAVGRASLAPTKSVSKSGVRFVYFDINGCLIHFFHHAFVKIAQETGAPADVIETAFWHYNDEVCRGTMRLSDFNAALAERIGVPAIDWQSYYLDAVEPIPGVNELVTWTAGQYRIGLLTNIMPGFVGALRGRGLLPDVPYDVIVDSSEAGAIKPEPAIYQLAAQRAGVKPDEILLIDDGRANIMAAEKLGWHVLWFDDYQPAESIARVRQALEPASPAID